MTNVWARFPDVPLTVIVWVPRGVDVEDIAKTADPVPPDVRGMLAGLRLAWSPVGLTGSARFTVPANPSRLVSVIVV